MARVGIATWSGTSMATPFVAVQTALIESTDGSDAEALIQHSARPMEAKNPPYAGSLGAGLERLQPNACS